MLAKTLRAISYAIISIVVLLVLYVVYLWADGKYTYWKYYSYKPIKEKSIMLTKVFDSKIKEDFNGWGYFKRGLHVFYKDTQDTSKYYTILFSNQNDTLRFQVVANSHYELFNHDFDTNIECDSSISCVELSQYNDTLVNVAYTIWNTRDTIYSKQFTVQQLFPLKNPFTYFSSVTKIVDEYKIATIYHDEDNLSMVLSDYYKLYYMPNLDDDSSRKAFLKRTHCEYESIEQIAQGWYLIKLSEPLDFG